MSDAIPRDELEHVGWFTPEGVLVRERQSDADRAVFLIPPRVVEGVGELEVIFGAG